MTVTRYPHGIFAVPNIGGGDNLSIFSSNNIWFVDGDVSGSGDGSINSPMKTIQEAVTAASVVGNGDGGVIYVKARDMAAGSSDPVSYAENIIIPATGAKMALIGVSGNRTQMGLPQIKVGGTVASTLLTIRAVGCLIANLGFNGNSTAGAPLNVGIKLDSDGATGLISSLGTTITNCHFKNCTGSTVTDARTGGAITWSANGDGWQVLIKGNRFYKNVCDVCLLGTSNTVPQDVIIEDNIFSGPLLSVDCNLWLAGGSGMNGVIVRNNEFPLELPNITSGAVKRYADMTGCVGLFSGNRVGGVYTTAGFGVAKVAAKIPTTVGIAQNYSDSGLIVREA